MTNDEIPKYPRNDECRSRKVLDKRVKGALIQVFVDDMAKVPARAPERERRVS